VQNPTVVFYAARAVKVLLLDDALRGQAVMVGIPRVLVQAVDVWEEEVPCLREILAALQTLTWDKHAVKRVRQAGISIGFVLHKAEASSGYLLAAGGGCWGGGAPVDAAGEPRSGA
jgi:hypothetical protein